MSDLKTLECILSMSLNVLSLINKTSRKPPFDLVMKSMGRDSAFLVMSFKFPFLINSNNSYSITVAIYKPS